MFRNGRKNDIISIEDPPTDKLTVLLVKLCLENEKTMLGICDEWMNLSRMDGNGFKTHKRAGANG